MTTTTTTSTDLESVEEFRVRARDSRGNVGAFNATSTWQASPALEPTGFGRVVTDGLSYRTGPGTGNARLGSIAERTRSANSISVD